MKYFRQILLFSTILLLSSNVFARAQKDFPCPPVAVIKNSIFNQATHFNDFINWEIASNPFEYQGKKWTVLFGFSCYDIKKPEAIEAGQKIFSHLTLEEPTQELSRSITMCGYFHRDGYYVAAISSVNI